MVSENYPLEANAQIFLFQALLAGVHLKVTAGAFLKKWKDPDILERAFCGKIKMKYCFGYISVSSGGGGPKINVGWFPQEMSVSVIFGEWQVMAHSKLVWWGWSCVHTADRAGEQVMSSSLRVTQPWGATLLFCQQITQQTHRLDKLLHPRKLGWLRLEVVSKIIKITAEINFCYCSHLCEMILPCRVRFFSHTSDEPLPQEGALLLFTVLCKRMHIGGRKCKAACEWASCRYLCSGEERRACAGNRRVFLRPVPQTMLKCNWEAELRIVES